MRQTMAAGVLGAVLYSGLAWAGGEDQGSPGSPTGAAQAETKEELARFVAAEQSGFRIHKPTINGAQANPLEDKRARDYVKAVAKCIKEEATHNTKAAGSLTVSFTVDATGKVLAPSVDKATFECTPLKDCILATLRATTFAPPPPPGKDAVVFGVTFSPRAASVTPQNTETAPKGSGNRLGVGPVGPAKK